MSVFYIKRNDTSPSILKTLEAPAGTAVDITGATVRFHMISKTDGSTKVDAAATIVTAASGIVRYDWLAADTDTAGDYHQEWEVTFSDSTIETFPNDGSETITITADLL